MHRWSVLLLPLILMFAGSLAAQDHRHAVEPSPYAGLESRAIKSLSDADIAELLRGGSRGLALPAELNGAPGPAHLLELRDEIGLSGEQVAAIAAIYDAMKAEAITLGEQLIAAETDIENAFADGTLDPAALRDLIARSEAARAKLRYVHLSRHLATPPPLSDRQIAQYNALRGYGEAPCGHDRSQHDMGGAHDHGAC